MFHDLPLWKQCLHQAIHVKELYFLPRTYFVNTCLLIVSPSWRIIFLLTPRGASFTASVKTSPTLPTRQAKLITCDCQVIVKWVPRTQSQHRADSKTLKNQVLHGGSSLRVRKPGLIDFTLLVCSSSFFKSEAGPC
jgi:hypothetical protein